MTKDQKIVAAGAASGVAAMVGGMIALYSLWPLSESLGGLLERLAYTLRADAIAALPLLVGIIAVGNDRFLSEAIDPTRHKESLATQINGRVVENTLQQYVLFLIGTLALCTVIDQRQMALIPAAATVFVVARIAFWIGYRIDPLYRAFGMAATGYLNLAILAYVAWCVLF
jgi:MAPEG family